MKTIIAKNTWLAEAGLRLDASYHLSEGNISKVLIHKSPYDISIIRDFSDRIFYGGRSKRIYVTNINKGVPFISSSDMLKSDLKSIKSVSKKYTISLDSALLKKDWILVSRSGTVGNTTYTNADFEEKAASEHIIRIIPNQNIKSGFLYAYLSSKIGFSLLTQGIFGAVIQHIEPEHIENIPIPNFPNEFQEEIQNLIIKSGELRVEGNQFLEDAIGLFENRIGSTRVSISSQNEIISVSKIRSFLSRFDAQYQIITKKLDIEKCTSIEYEKISNFAKRIFVGNRGKRNYVENGIPFLSSSDMVLFNPKRYAKQISHRTPGLNNLLVNRNDILISRSGTVGNVVLVGEDLKNSAVSEHALRLEIDNSKIAPEYVFCYLKTKQGKMYMEASAFGSVIITLNEDLIGNIDVPMLAKDDRDYIVSKIKNYIEKLDLATLKENQAIQLVENEIEQWQN